MGNVFSPNEESFDVVLDIDDTIVYQDFATKNPDILLRYPESVRMDTYRLIPGALPFLVTLAASIPDLRLSFYSAGEEQRNIMLVAQLMDLVNKDIAKQFGTSRGWLRHFKILSRQHVDGLGRKNILMIHRSLSLDRAILIDDNMTAYKDHEPNLIQVTPPPRRSRSLANKSSSAKYREEANSRSNKCLIYALGKILYCYDKWKHEKIGVPASIKQFHELLLRQQRSSLDKDTDSDGGVDVDGERVFYELGLHEIQKYYPGFDLAQESS